MGTTTNYAIPYPEPTDFVTDGATAMENIAEKVDAALQAGAVARNILYNGAMQITQRGTGTSGITAPGFFTADRWRINLVTYGQWTQQILTTSDDYPGGTTGTFSGFRQSMKITCNVADAAPAAGDLLLLGQGLEGVDVQAFKKGSPQAQQMTVSFWVRTNVSGTYICELVDNDNSRTCSRSYVVNATNTWEYKTLTFPADTTGRFDNDVNGSLFINFWLAAGSTFTSGTLQTTWGTLTQANRAVGTAMLGATVGNYWQMTGAQLVVGASDVPFQFKQYAQELRECYRYYQTGTLDDFPIGPDTFYGTGHFSLLYPVPMRTTPTGTWSGQTFVAGAGSGTVRSGSIGGTSQRMQATTSGANVWWYYGSWNAESELT